MNFSRGTSLHRATRDTTSNRALLLLPFAALLAILPLLVHGCSCGHDLVFHVQSWLDAAQQLRHGHYPHWAFSPAWNAGEPRFLFYPPLSWLLGALLVTIFPAAAAPTIYIWIALTAAGLSMYRLAVHFTRKLAPSASLGSRSFISAPNAALLASALYLANPYMLFNAFERSALAELLAAAWIPLLLLAALRERPTVRGIAIPVALLWLTNAPAAVMGCYTLAFLATLRLLAALLSTRQNPVILSQAKRRRRACPELVEGTPKPFTPPLPSSPSQPQSTPLHLTLTYLAGAALGLALPAFYLVPAAFERRYIQVAMAIIPNLRFQDNFLFTRTDYAPHNTVTYTISVLAVVLILLTSAFLSAVLLVKDIDKPVTSTELSRVHRQAQRKHLQPAASPAASLAILTLLLTFLLVPLSTPIWQHLPELAFLQFPWRLLTILAAILALALALLFSAPNGRSLPAGVGLSRDMGEVLTRGAPFMTRLSRGMGGVLTRGAPFMPRLSRGMRGVLILLAALLCPVALTFLCFHLYGQACAPTDRPSAVAALFRTHHGAAPTDEYTPTDGDNDVLRTDDPGFWLAPNPQAFAPHTIPNPNATNPDYDRPTPIDETVSTRAPLHLTLNLPFPQDLILNLRDYPDWLLTDRIPGHASTTPAHLQRDDGLLAIALPAGPSAIDIHWRRTPDQELGLALSACALLALIFLCASNRSPM